MTVPALGFGTAPILGGISRRRGLVAIRRAYELGVRHFDTARSYGWGEAESVLGAFLATVPRESVTIVTKCGIVPVRRSRVLTAAKTTARGLIKFFPAIRGVVQKAGNAAQFAPRHTYDIGLLDNSVRTSLAELGIDWLDVLLLHNFEPDKEGFEDVVAWMRDLQARGLIRKFGFSIEGDLLEGLAYLDRHGLLDEALVQAPVSAALFDLPLI